MFVVCPKCAAKYRIPPEITLKEGQKVQCSACQHIFGFQPQKDENQNESSVLGLQIPENPVLAQNQMVVHEEKIVYSHELPEAFKPLSTIQKQSSYAWLWGMVCFVVLLFFVVTIWFYRDIFKQDFSSSSIRSANTLPRAIQSSKKPYDNAVEIDIPLFPDEEDKIHVDVKNLSVFQCDAFRFHSVHFRYEAAGLLIDGIIHNNTNSAQLMPSSIYATAYDHQGQALFQKEIFLQKEFIQPYGQKAFYGTYSPAPDGVQWIEVSCKK